MGRTQTQRVPASDPMALLAAGVPLTLLYDLLILDRELSTELARTERADTGWVHRAA
jgi:hypothetical protein